MMLAPRRPDKTVIRPDMTQTKGPATGQWRGRGGAAINRAPPKLFRHYGDAR
jgi:hypothetical protein